MMPCRYGLNAYYFAMYVDLCCHDFIAPLIKLKDPRNSFTSKAYQRSRSAALKSGKTAEEAKAVAKAACNVETSCDYIAHLGELCFDITHLIYLAYRIRHSRNHYTVTFVR